MNAAFRKSRAQEAKNRHCFGTHTRTSSALSQSILAPATSRMYHGNRAFKRHRFGVFVAPPGVLALFARFEVSYGVSLPYYFEPL
jgi:hypothetical protein